MKKILSIFILSGLLLTGCYNTGEPRGKVLKIYNWADYIGEGVLEDFQAYYKEQTGEDIRIVYQTLISMKLCLPRLKKGMRILMSFVLRSILLNVC